MPLSQLMWDGAKWRGYGVPDIDPNAPGGGNPTSRDSLVYGTYKPQDDTTVGLLPGVPLTDGPTTGVTYSQVATQANPVIVENMKFRNQVFINGAQNLIFKNCWFQGAPNPGTATNMECVRGVNANNRGIVFQDCLFKPQNPNYSTSGTKGAHHTTFLRCEFTEVIDGIGFVNNGGHSATNDQSMYVVGCWFHDLAYMSPDPDAAGGYTDNAGHVDCIQLRGGYNHYIMGNNFDSFISSTVGVGYTMSDDEYEWSTRGDNTTAAVINTGSNRWGNSNVQAVRHNTGNKYYYYQDLSDPDPITEYATFVKYAPAGQPQTQTAWNAAHPGRTLAYPFPQWAAATSVVMMSPALGDISVLFEKNWVDGGAYSINCGDYSNGSITPYKANALGSKDLNGTSVPGITIRNNSWGRGMRGGSTATVIAHQSLTMSITGNTFWDNGAAANMRGNGGA